MLWTIKEEGFQKDKIVHRGNQFLIGHALLGIRGTLDEYRKEQLVGINLPFVYDQVGEGWREPINIFNPLYSALYVDDKEWSLLTHTPIKHEQILSMKDAVMKRMTVFSIQGIEVTFTSERFVSLAHERLIACRLSIQSSQPIKIELKTGIDQEIWDINGPHMKDVRKSISPYLSISGTTHEKGHQIEVIKKIQLNDKLDSKSFVDTDGVFNNCLIDTTNNQKIMIDYFSIIGVDVPHDELIKTLEEVSNRGYDQLLSHHQDIWDKRWKQADVLIIGDDEAQRALRYSIYHLLLLSPNRKPKLSVPARGISGQTYKGAVFWDTEIFMLPFYLNTDYLSARRIIEYRIQGLKGAKEKAKYYGYQGAFYAWESQEEGYDACTDYNVTDALTGRKVRTYFKDKQIHISGDVIYAIQQYINHTEDYSILQDGALEVILEVSRFYLDYGQYALLKDRFEIKDVMGPDEYHERVHNNAFTNQLVKMVFETVLYYQTWFSSQGDPFFDDLIKRLEYIHMIDEIKKITPKVYVKPIQSDGFIEQFDGYLLHRDVRKDDLLKQKLHPNEYLGGHGLAGDTQIIKQADVITMLYLFKERYHTSIIKTNWTYYEPRTEHGSSLSASMYALTSCLMDEPMYAYPLFMKSASIDLTGDSKDYAGGIYIGGTHPAASGGAYMTAIFGFAGVELGDTLSLNPKLPPSFKEMRFRICYKHRHYQCLITRHNIDIQEVSP